MALAGSVLSERTKQSISVGETSMVTKEQFSLDQQTKVVETTEQPTQDVIQLKQIVFFDLETGGLFNESDILQIAAIDCDGHEFNAYCRPTKPISRSASRINELTYKDDVMYYRKKAVPSEDIRDALIQFGTYLESLPVDRVLLIAHNAAFDKRFLTYHVAKHGLQNFFYPKLLGYADSVKFFKRFQPGRNTYKLGSLTHQYLPKKAADELHNAVTDVINLQALFRMLVLVPMLDEKRAVDRESKLPELEYQQVDLQGKTIVPPKSKSKKTTKKTVKKAAIITEEDTILSENKIRHVEKLIRYTETVDEVIVEKTLPRRALSRTCKKKVEEIQLDDDDDDDKEHKPTDRKRSKSSKNYGENTYTKVKSKGK